VQLRGQIDACHRHAPEIALACVDGIQRTVLESIDVVAGGSCALVDALSEDQLGFSRRDEIVEARKDTTVIIHPLSDDRRFLPIEKKGQILEAADDFLLVISYNPGYQTVLKELKQSTKQRFMAIEFDYPAPDIETTVVEREAGVSRDLAASLVKLGGKVRNLKNHGLEEGVSTRLLIYAGTLIRQGVATDRACDVAIARPITDDPDMQRSIVELVKAIF
jgi:nitric oxide reductase NorQ protein